MNYTEASPGRRAASYWFVDGVPEMISGLALALLGAVGLWSLARPLPWIERVCLFGLMILLLAILLGFDRRIAHYIKARLTYPRTGYARPPVPLVRAEAEGLFSLGLAQQPPPDQNVTGYLTHTVMSLLLSRFAFNTLINVIETRWVLPLAMSLVAAAVYFLNRHGERPYSWWSVLFLPAGALLVVSLDIKPDAQQWLAPALGGVWLSIQGVYRLFGYIRHNPRPSAPTSVPV